jgi:cytochrome c553
MNRIVRIGGTILAGLLVLLLLAAVVGWFSVQRQMSARFNRPVQEVTVANTPEQVERGAYLVRSIPGCEGCHASDLTTAIPLLDGRQVTDAAVLGEIYGPNLTPGGRLKDWTDGEIVRAIREGLDPDGRALFLMPSEDYNHLSDEDVQAIVAFLRSQPAVAKQTPPTSYSPLTYALLAAGQLSLAPQPPVQQVSAPTRGPTKEYGAYQVEIAGCRTCHGAALDGQNIPQGPPPGPTLHGVKAWTEAQFLTAMHTGTTPAGRQMATTMPWQQYGKATDDDLRAVYEYLKSLQ